MNHLLTILPVLTLYTVYLLVDVEFILSFTESDFKRSTDSQFKLSRFTANSRLFIVFIESDFMSD